MTPPNAILQLVERFEHNRQAYRSGRYDETQVHREFIDPLFEALGWDVANRQGYAEAYKDVVQEETLKVGGGTKARIMAFVSAASASFSWRPRSPRWTSRGTRPLALQSQLQAFACKRAGSRCGFRRAKDDVGHGGGGEGVVGLRAKVETAVRRLR